MPANITLTPQALKGRPVWIKVCGTEHYLFLQDVRHLMKKVEYQERIKVEHPDKHMQRTAAQRRKQDKRFRSLLQHYRWWEKRQDYEYRQIGIAPPALKDFSPLLNLRGT